MKKKILKTAAKTKSSRKPAGHKKSVEAASKKTKNRADGDGDIIQLILKDHKPLKKLIKTLKDVDQSFSDRKEAFEQFAQLLTVHALSEEQVLYVDMKQEGQKKDLRQEGNEGDVEHSLAKEMIERTKDADDDKDLWTASAKVLAELVEHHIKEEEDDILPDFKKSSTPDERFNLGHEYLAKKAEFEEPYGESRRPSDHPSRSLAQ